MLAIIFAIGFGVGGCGGALQCRMYPLAFRPYDSFSCSQYSCLPLLYTQHLAGPSAVLQYELKKSFATLDVKSTWVLAFGRPRFDEAAIAYMKVKMRKIMYRFIDSCIRKTEPIWLHEPSPRGGARRSPRGEALGKNVCHQSYYNILYIYII